MDGSVIIPTGKRTTIPAVRDAADACRLPRQRAFQRARQHIPNTDGGVTISTGKRPPGLNATLVTQLVCPSSVRIGAPVAASHR